MTTMTMSVAEAEAAFSALLERAASGQEVVITRHGKPYARVMPIEQGAVDREPGILGWAPGTHDPAMFAPMTDGDMAAEGWP